MPDARCTRSLMRAIGVNYAHECSQRATGITRHSRTQWFTAYLVLSPERSALLPPSPRRSQACPTRLSRTNLHEA
jgi:hypothetical protein